MAAKKTTKKSKARRYVGNIGYGFFLVFILFCGVVAGVLSSDSLVRSLVASTFMPKNPTQVFKKDSVTFLLLGCDEDRFYKGTMLHGSNIRRKYARADMILVAKLDFANRKITGVSIPRDTEVRVPGIKGYRKINAFHAIAKRGEEDALQEKAVETLLKGVDIDQVLVIDYDAFQALVNSVGGIDVNVKEAMDYDDNAGELHIHLKPGKQRLNGYDAMGYVRFRHDRESDFGRQERQKLFLNAFKSAVLRNLTNIGEVARLSKEVLNNKLDDDQIVALVSFSKNVKPSDIKLGMVPVLPGNGSRLRVDSKKLPKVLREFNLVDSETSTQTE